MLHYVLAAAMHIRCSTVLLSGIATHLPSHLILHYFLHFIGLDILSLHSSLECECVSVFIILYTPVHSSATCRLSQ